jgi:hypothetical protein
VAIVSLCSTVVVLNVGLVRKLCVFFDRLQIMRPFNQHDFAVFNTLFFVYVGRKKHKKYQPFDICSRNSNSFELKGQFM